MASSLLLFSLYANSRVSNELGREKLMQFFISSSKHFITADVGATGR
jgi:hypothetical protein